MKKYDNNSVTSWGKWFESTFKTCDSWRCGSIVRKPIPHIDITIVEAVTRLTQKQSHW